MAFAVHLRSALAFIGPYPVLAGVDLDVAEGEVVHLQGANGAGKTSLLRACAGLLPLSGGDAVVLGHDLRVDRRSVRRSVGLLGHAGFLYDDLTVADNVTFAVRAAGANAEEVGPALARLGLAGRLRDVPVARLSAGQRRRVALAILAARRPRLWLLDEPHAGLDAEHRDLVDAIVRDVAADGGTVLFASHERERASGLAGRVAIVAGGIIVPPESAPPAPAVSAPNPEAVHVA
jgi:heme ABC exporter ATP-binding subunit CcmA